MTKFWKDLDHILETQKHLDRILDTRKAQIFKVQSWGVTSHSTAMVILTQILSIVTSWNQTHTEEKACD